MNIRLWWERMRGARGAGAKRALAKRPGAKRTGLRPRRNPGLPPALRPDMKLPGDDPIQARVDLVRYGAFAEAAAESMQLPPVANARERYDEAMLYFARAMEAAQRAGLGAEGGRLKLRAAVVKRTYEVIRKAELRNQRSEIRKGTPPPRSDI